jgi:hypothetical protein
MLARRYLVSHIVKLCDYEQQGAERIVTGAPQKIFAS